MFKYNFLKKVLFSLMAVTGILLMTTPVVSAQDQAAPATSTAPVTSQEEAASNADSVVIGNIADNVCKGVLSTKDGTIESDANIQACRDSNEEGFGFLARRIINLFSIVVGAVSVIMIIIGGFRYIISGGDSSNVQAAKNTILYAIVGLLIVLFAQVIIRFILANATQTG